MEQALEKRGNIRNKQGKFVPGISGNPNGRPQKTPEQKLYEKMERKAIQELVKEYKSTLAEALPKIGSVLIKSAEKGNLTAIKEINAVVIGKDKEIEEDKSTIQSMLTDEQMRRIAIHILERNNT